MEESKLTEQVIVNKNDIANIKEDVASIREELKEMSLMGTTVTLLNKSVENLNKTVEKLGEKVDTMALGLTEIRNSNDSRDAKRYNSIVDKIITALVGGICGYILFKLGLG